MRKKGAMRGIVVVVADVYGNVMAEYYYRQVLGVVY